MRITGGQARGIPLNLPKGDAVRPATDALRQSVFSSIAAYVPGARFLDLFAGSGAYGLEAFSRGAEAGIFVEKDAHTAAFIKQNIASVCKSLGKPQSLLRVVTADATSTMPGDPPDLVFVDPPYEIIPEVAPKIFAKLAPLLTGKPDALLIFEMPGELDLASPGWIAVKRLGKGGRQPTAVIFRPSPASP